jgi:hypothetical protein
MTDLEKAKQLLLDLDQRLATFRLDHLDRIVGRNQNQGSRVDQSIIEHVWDNLNGVVNAVQETRRILQKTLREADIPF